MNILDRIAAEYSKRGRNPGPDIDFFKGLTEIDIHDYLRLEDRGDRTDGDRIVWAAKQMGQKRISGVTESILQRPSSDGPVSAQAAFLYHSYAFKLGMPLPVLQKYLEMISSPSNAHLVKLHSQIVEMAKA